MSDVKAWKKTRTGVACPTPQKSKYSNEHRASKALGRLLRKFGERDDGLEVYECACGYWHLGRPRASPYRSL